MVKKENYDPTIGFSILIFIGVLIFGTYALIDSIIYSVVGESPGYEFWSEVKGYDPEWRYNNLYSFIYGIIATSIEVIVIVLLFSRRFRKIIGFHLRNLTGSQYRKEIKELEERENILEAEFSNKYNPPISLHEMFKEKKVIRTRVKKPSPKKSITSEGKARKQDSERPALISGDYIICHQCGWENVYDRETCDMCDTELRLDNAIYDFDKRVQIKQESVSYIREENRDSYGNIVYRCPKCEWSYVDYTIDFCDQCGEDLHKYDIPKSEYRLKKKQEHYKTSLINEVSKILSKKALINKKKKEKRKEYLQRAVSSQKNDELKGYTRHISNKVRTEVWNRDKASCVICGSQKNLEFDHIIPFSKGGRSVADNIQLLCQRCNRKKFNKIKIK